MTVFNLENKEENKIGVGPNVYVRACMTIPHRDIKIYDIRTSYVRLVAIYKQFS